MEADCSGIADNLKYMSLSLLVYMQALAVGISFLCGGVSAAAAELSLQYLMSHALARVARLSLKVRVMLCHRSLFRCAFVVEGRPLQYLKSWVA